VNFTDIIDPAFMPFQTAGNYSISPALTVFAAIIDGAQSVRLLTSAQSEVLYTVTVDQGRSIYGDVIDPWLKTATFNGLSPAATFYPVAVKPSKIRLVFSLWMLNDSELIDPANYEILDVQSGAVVPILSVTPETSTNIRGLAVELGANLQIGTVYQATVGPLVRTLYSGDVYPETEKFQWFQGSGHLSISMDAFSGETRGGLLGEHGGLIYFSPAFDVPAPNSIIEVDSCSVCTKAYDEYHIPSIPDPNVLYTFGTGTTSAIGGGSVLWAPKPRISEAHLDLADLQEDVIAPPVDSHCIATFREPWDQDYVSLLNNTHWKLFDNGTEPPVYFATAANLAPIPPGPTVTVVLQPPP
jgi:hypothetical protein